MFSAVHQKAIDAATQVSTYGHSIGLRCGRELKIRGKKTAEPRGMRIAAIACHELGLGTIGPDYRIVGNNRAPAAARAGSVPRRDWIPFFVDGQSIVRSARGPARSGCCGARGPLSSPSDWFASPGPRFSGYIRATSRSTLNCLTNCSSRGCNPAEVASGSPNWKIFRRKSLRLFPWLTYSAPKSAFNVARNDARFARTG